MKSTVVSSNDSSVESINSCPPNFTVPSVHFSNQHFDIPHSSVPISNVPNSHEIIVSHANDHRIPTLNVPMSSECVYSKVHNSHISFPYNSMSHSEVPIFTNASNIHMPMPTVSYLSSVSNVYLHNPAKSSVNNIYSMPNTFNMSTGVYSQAPISHNNNVPIAHSANFLMDNNYIASHSSHMPKISNVPVFPTTPHVPSMSNDSKSSPQLNPSACLFIPSTMISNPSQTYSSLIHSNYSGNSVPTPHFAQSVSNVF